MTGRKVFEFFLCFFSFRRVKHSVTRTRINKRKFCSQVVKVGNFRVTMELIICRHVHDVATATGVSIFVDRVIKKQYTNHAFS